MLCEDVRSRMAAMDDDAPVDLMAQRHIETCLGCHAEVTRYGKMLRALGELRDVCLHAPFGLLEDTLAGIGGPSIVRVMSSRQKAALAGTLGAVAAGAAATAMVVARRRGLRLVTVFAR